MTTLLDLADLELALRRSGLHATIVPPDEDANEDDDDEDDEPVEQELERGERGDGDD
ncbi:MAG TPA: hypothetical protein VIJ12_03470 [Candidatus Baltobacteraceae bacterium]